ncbi:hypothetical protein E5161_01825 [Cohnella pontilimi]|uniref:Uncharacterized protein n=1 Tax=Cohnella pontilimi TaxID=2564100 RepID=A0A4U0FGX0_9BACL|nr:hypothetical protein [Cohnella pontilimi]TJY44158.1 hypothetical protein E5161_01825 [Cohnella pontilimi]
MHTGAGYVVLWIVLTFFPIMTAWKRKWAAFTVYLAGWILFLFSVLDRKDGWDDLAGIATFIVVILPIYLAASIIWLLSLRDHRRMNK